MPSGTSATHSAKTGSDGDSGIVKRPTASIAMPMRESRGSLSHATSFPRKNARTTTPITATYVKK